MSRQYHGRDMDRPDAPSSSVRRARERAPPGPPIEEDRLQPPPFYTRDNMNMDEAPPGALRAPPRRMMGPPQAPPPPPPSGQLRVPKPRAPPPPNDSRGAISRPTQVPQWPLPGPLPHHDPDRYRPPPGRSQQAPPRPPRPSQVPSMLDQSRLQDPAPVFFNPDSDYYSDSPTSPSSQTSSNFGDSQDHAANNASTQQPGARRGTALGPPPSARRGASSFYSNPSYVSPIPEESLNSATRSHGSYASSAAMPESWPAVSREQSPTFYDDVDGDKSRGYDDITDESKLVRSASIGKRGKPALVHTKSSGSAGGIRSPVERRKSQNERQESQNSWLAMTTPNLQSVDESKPTAPTPDAILGAYAAASATDLADKRMKSPEPRVQQQAAIPRQSFQPQIHPNPQFNPPSTLRRPPRLDIDAVRSMEERGSMTSLPDLIRRATRLATMMDRGRRPASRFDDINEYLDEKSHMHSGEKESSGLSDMLAAFPPPAHPHARRSRGSWFRTTSWPLAPHRDLLPPSRAGLRNVAPQNEGKKDKRGRCCGLPMWAFILLILLLIGVVAAAVLVPLEFFVFKNLVGRGSSTTELSQCQKSLTCQNGGTNVITSGTCSCICTNGYTGSDCSTSGSDGCTTTDLVSTDEETISNVTLGKALPRLIGGSNSNFSIPLSGTDVLAKINSSDLSCIAQNSLVTFDGSSTRTGSASDRVKATSQKQKAGKRDTSAAPAATTAISVSPDDAATTLVVDTGSPTATGSVAAPEATTTDSAQPTATFTVTEEVLDFARVAVLYVLQEESVDEAEDAQTSLQDFFSAADATGGVTQTKAASLKIGGSNTIDLVNYSLNIGNGTIGGKTTKRDVADGFKLVQLERDLGLGNSRRGGAVLPPR